MNNTAHIQKENNSRTTLYFRDYDRIIGDPEGEVVPRTPLNYNNHTIYIPTSLANTPICQQLKTETPKQIIQKYTGTYTPEKEKQFIEGLTRDRLKHDFEFWAYICVKIQDKLTKKQIPLKLNRGQRRLIAKFEQMRTDNLPIRVILVKARQWGGSTATQTYMLWLQLFHFKNWHSAIVTQYKQQAANIRATITKIIATYPTEITPVTITPYEGMTGIKQIPQRGCIIGIGSAENPDALRSFDFAMLHLSEVGLWKSTLTKNADDLVQTLYSTVPDVPGSFIVLESTAKGVGNFFHTQYQDAVNGISDLQPVFVPWYEIEMYNHFLLDNQNQVIRDNGQPLSRIKNIQKFIETLTDYEWTQWQAGATLEGISWYRNYKKGKRYNDFQMKSEFPTTANEAFQSNSARYFDDKNTAACRRTCKPPLHIGDIRADSLIGKNALKNIQTIQDGNGPLAIWAKPETDTNQKITHRYLVTVDIGGKHHKSDWSTINVFDRAMLSDPNGALERVATYIDHIDHDILAWKAAQIATYYDNALLAIESNTLETRDRKKTETQFEGDHFFTVLNEIADHYDNLYTRETDPDKTKGQPPVKYGWHTNKRTKYLAYDCTRAAIRDGEYIERDRRCVDEMEYLETKTDGTLGAIPGQHDDIIDPTAIAIYISTNEMPLPKHITPKPPTHHHTRTGGEATI